MKKSISLVAAFIITIGTIIGMAYAVETHYAKASEMRMVESDISDVNDRIDAMKLEDEILLIKKKLYSIEDRWGSKFKEEHGRYHHTIDELLAFMPKEYRNEYRELKERLDQLEKRLDKIRNKDV